LLGPGPRVIKKRIYLAAVSQMFINTALQLTKTYCLFQLPPPPQPPKPPDDKITQRPLDPVTPRLPPVPYYRE